MWWRGMGRGLGWVIRLRRRRCWRPMARVGRWVRPLWLGSVKSNMGHAQAAAGVAGVIKMVQALRYGVLPRTLHVDAPTPEVDWSAGGVELLTESRSWPVVERPRRAGVSAFGISGTNAHVILEQAPEFEPSDLRSTVVPAPEPVSGLVVGSGVVSVVVSGRSWAGLVGTAGRLAGRVRECADAEELSAVAGGLVGSRAVLERRAVVIGSDPAGIADGLDRLADSGAEGASAGGVVQVGDAAWLVTADPLPLTPMLVLVLGWCWCFRVRVVSGWGWWRGWWTAVRCSRPGWLSVWRCWNR